MIWPMQCFKCNNLLKELDMSCNGGMNNVEAKRVAQDEYSTKTFAVFLIKEQKSSVRLMKIADHYKSFLSCYQCSKSNLYFGF